MPIDLKPYLEPKTTAILVIECQEGVIGPEASLRGLVQSVQESGMVHTLARFLDSARGAGARVYHCTVEKRQDGFGEPFNTPLTARLRGRESGNAMYPGSPAAATLKELGPAPEDIMAPRAHGMTAFNESGLDSLLRASGVRTVIPTGVSVNIAITGATLEAVNRGYHVIIPTDCVAGDPPSYAQDALRYCLRNLAFLTTAEDIAAIWGQETPGGVT